MAALKGYVCIVLHSHLPYVLGHGTWPFGSDWLCEAAAETYIPILSSIEKLYQEGIRANITIGVSPVLAEQLADPRFSKVFQTYLDQKIEAATLDQKAFLAEGFLHRASLAEYWQTWYRHAKEEFLEHHQENLLMSFRRLQDKGALEILTCGASHGYLPLLGTQGAVRGQVKTAVEVYRKHFGKNPRGIWLPECAYRPQGDWWFMGSPRVEERPGLEEVLSDFDLDHFVVDASLISGQTSYASYLARFLPPDQIPPDIPIQDWQVSRIEKPIGPEGPARGAARIEPRDATVLDIYRVEDPSTGKGATAFVRDPEVALQVWSGEMGYPGEPCYLDFHKKHHPGGMRYWSVTGPKVDMAEKLEYNLAYPENQAREHAKHFVSLCKNRILWAENIIGEPATVTAPFDTELFGHWWFEGPKFLQEVIRQISLDPEIDLLTMEQRVDVSSNNLRAVKLQEGSWGEEGDHRVWLNEGTTWTWNLVHNAERKLAQFAKQQENHPLLKRVLSQMSRSVALLEASDWQFLIHTRSAKSYAEERVITHSQDADFLVTCAEQIIETGELSSENLSQLEALEARDRLFPEIDASWWV